MNTMQKSTRPAKAETADLTWKDAVKFAATIIAAQAVVTVALRCLVSAAVDVAVEVVEENV